MAVTTDKSGPELLLELAEQLAQTQRDELDLIRVHRRHIERLDADLIALANRIEALYRSTAPLRAGKQRLDLTTCESCGGSFESEPGPPLCGRCWTELGRPTVWPLPESRRA